MKGKKKMIIGFSVGLLSAIATCLGIVYLCLAQSKNLDNRMNETGQPNNETPISKKRFALPYGYQKVKVDSGSFAAFLRNLPLKPYGADLHRWDGEVIQSNYDGGIVDLDFGHKEAEQCADAVIYLRALWLWKTRQYDKIHFDFTNGFKADYSRWAHGERIHVNPENWHCSWAHEARSDYSYNTFRKYLDIVFYYAGTASLEKELQDIPIGDLRAGDVLINGGYPGHAEIIVDEATNKEGDKVYLLAQSYTPAQEIEVFNHWFEIAPNANSLETPGWVFTGKYAKRFRQE